MKRWQVLLSIVTGTRYSMLVHPEITGNVTVALKDVTVREALDSLRDQPVPATLRTANRRYSGVLGSAADLVSFDAEDEPAVRIHLARVLVVDNLDTATRVAKEIERDVMLDDSWHGLARYWRKREAAGKADSSSG